jgi:hypothetical protein
MGVVEDVVKVENVEIIRDMGWALFCRIGGKMRFIPQALLVAGSVREGGEHGTMLMPKGLAVSLGLS